MPLSQRPSAKRPLSETNIINEESVPLNSEKSDEDFDQNVFSFLKVSTCKFNELPSWMQDNKDIHGGYRRPTCSYLKCAQSLFYIHNEFGKLVYVLTTYKFMLECW